MSRTESAIERARQRMLEADRVKNTRDGDDPWDAWQRAATDYWILLHPDLARLRRGDPTVPPTITEMQERAESLAHALHGVPETWRLAPPSSERTEHLARVGWFHEQIAGLYGPIEDSIDRLRGGEASGVETLVRFLEADVYCFRSGYIKADAIRFLKRAAFDEPTAERLRRVVIAVVRNGDRREFRAYVRLARRLDSDAFRDELREVAASASQRSARHARWALAGLGDGAFSNE